jgi:hypothetical protein
MKAVCLIKDVVSNIIKVGDDIDDSHPLIEDLKNKFGFEGLILVPDDLVVDIGWVHDKGSFSKSLEQQQKEDEIELAKQAKEIALKNLSSFSKGSVQTIEDAASVLEHIVTIIKNA